MKLWLHLESGYPNPAWGRGELRVVVEASAIPQVGEKIDLRGFEHSEFHFPDLDPENIPWFIVAKITYGWHCELRELLPKVHGFNHFHLDEEETLLKIAGYHVHGDFSNWRAYVEAARQSEY